MVAQIIGIYKNLVKKSPANGLPDILESALPESSPKRKDENSQPADDHSGESAFTLQNPKKHN